MSGPVLILGSTGQIGTYLVERFGDTCIGLTREDMDLSSSDVPTQKSIKPNKSQRWFIK